MSVKNAINEARSSITTSLRALHPLASSSVSALTLPDLIPCLPESLSQLLTQLRHESTGLALAFKPPITKPAAIAQLTKVHEGYGRIVACVIAVSGGSASTKTSALVEEWNQGAESVGIELQRLLQIYEDVSDKSQHAGGSKTDEHSYLQHTGLVWDAIDTFSKDLSPSEIQAVGSSWKSQGVIVKDAWGEYKELMEAQDESEDGEVDDFLDDGDDEFGELEDMLSGGKGMSPEERARAERAKPLLALHQILHTTIPRYFPLLVLSPEESYRTLLDAGSALVAAFDASVSAMYPEQEVDEIVKSVSDLNTRSLDLIKIIRARSDRGKGDDVKREACRSFLSKWEDRLQKELQGWDERRMDLRSLGVALDENK